MVCNIVICNCQISGIQQTTTSACNSSRDASSPLNHDSDYKYGRFDASALHIAHALKQTELQKAYDKRREKPIDFYLVRNYNVLKVDAYFKRNYLHIGSRGTSPTRNEASKGRG